MLGDQALVIKKEVQSVQALYEEPKNQLYGLASVYHSSSSYFFSAHYAANHKKFLQQLFSIQPDQIIECPSKLEISEGQNVDPFEARTVLRETEKDLKDAFISDLSDHLFEKIFIVFEDMPDPELHRAVYKLCQENGIR